MELINKSEHEFFNVDTEEYRVYQYAEENKITEIKIEEPMYISVNPKNGGHRILDNKGVSHYIQPGWKHLYWKSKLDKPHFVK